MQQQLMHALRWELFTRMTSNLGPQDAKTSNTYEGPFYFPILLFSSITQIAFHLNMQAKTISI
jgi:hypothetical protein